VAGRRAIIIGAGPAGLTAALELLKRTDLVPTVLDRGTEVGGLASTRVHRGNRIDLGGHRFFTKSDRVLDWWLDLLPLEPGASLDGLAYRGQSSAFDRAAPDRDDRERVMLVRERQSRILYDQNLYRYPIRLDRNTLEQLGIRKVARIGATYARAAAFPRPEHSLEDFFVNRFGRELYETFFRSYTEKVWGVPCSAISAEWGAQRVKGLDVKKVLAHELRRRLGRPEARVETSLVERFLYPRLGPGQMWEEATRRIEARDGEVLLGQAVVGLETESGRVTAVVSRDLATGEERRHEAALVFSTTSIQELVRMLDTRPPGAVEAIAEGLQYRDFLTVGLDVERLRLGEGRSAGRIKDNWIYVHEPSVKVGRIQIFNNWSPAMVADPDRTWVGLEYFCARGDELWRKDDAEMIAFAERELVSLGAIRRGEARNGIVLRVPRTYPAYFGTYAQLGQVRTWLEQQLGNLWLVGRNGMHRYNNQDHSMLTAMTAVDNIVAGRNERENVWAINTEDSYLETRS
jgi:protoporphyrinogen oxidase